MKQVYLFLLLLLCTNTAVAQKEERCALETEDVYVLKVRFKDNVLKGRCPCYRKYKCGLREVEVLNIIYCPSKMLSDSTRLLATKYILINSQNEKRINIDTTVIVSVMPSGSKYYLSFSKVLKIENGIKYQFFHPHAYISSLNPCKRNNKFEKYILKH